MWLLHFLPSGFLEFIVNVIFLAGVTLSVIGFFLIKFIPGIQNIRKVICIVGIALSLTGAYLKGGYSVEREWRARVDEMQAKLDIAEKQSAELNTQLSEKIKTRTIVIKQKVTENAKTIEDKREAINSDCVVSDDAWLFYNRAVAPKVSDTTK